MKLEEKDSKALGMEEEQEEERKEGKEGREGGRDMDF